MSTVHYVMDMFRTDSQLCRLRNRTPVVQQSDRLHNGTSGCPTQILVAIPIHNRTPSRYATGRIIICNGRYAAGRTVLLLRRKISSRRKKWISYCVKRHSACTCLIRSWRQTTTTELWWRFNSLLQRWYRDPWRRMIPYSYIDANSSTHIAALV